MWIMNRRKLLKESEAFFCRSMAEGYAGGAAAMPLIEMPGWKGYVHVDGDWKLIDAYMVHPKTKKSVGHTYIWHQGTLIRCVSYGGFYQKEAVPCLKGALMYDYSRGIFNAGRGHNLYQVDNYRYIIRIDEPKPLRFVHFSAVESIVRIDREARDPRDPPETTPMGEHFICGMALI